MVQKIPVDPETQLKEIAVGVDEIISEEDLLAKLKDSYEKQKPLTVKLGADPSRPDIHLGHTVVINKLKLLQDFGHQVVFIIGDFTARIGDPTGKSKTRPQLTIEEVKENAQTYKDQIFKILNPEKTKVVFNGEWLDQLKPMDFVRLMATKTVQQLIARDDFSKRYQDQTPIFLHEFIYPVLQGYDSVHLKADIEMGGTDQKFNLLLARELQKQQNQRPQSLIIMPLLEGLDGVQKMSKSLDNYISLTDTPKDMFGKTMSISDDHMIRFYELLSRKGAQQIEQLKAGLKDQSIHPMVAKKDLTQEIVSQYWGEEKGKQERQQFESVFSSKKIPDDIASHSIQLNEQGKVNLLELAVELGFTKSKGEARRILKQNGMRIDQKVVSEESVSLNSGGEYVFKQGKLKIVKLKVD